MNPLRRWRRRLVLAALLCLTCRLFVFASDEPTLTKEQIKQFLLTAEVVNSREAKKGITHTSRLTLSDGRLTHDASFQPIDEHTPVKELSSGTELNFVDSYKNNIAAYELAKLLGLDDLLPVYVERKWKGRAGSLSWWLPVKMDEEERVKQKITPPNLEAWNNQMYRVRVFDELIYDTDANLTNVLIGQDWQIWRIDFTRAFREDKNVRKPANLVRCERHLFEKLKELNGRELEEKTRHYLDKEQVRAVMARRDRIVKQFQQLVLEKGENDVLY